ncbi:hypothetical protein NLI96_g9144 [Meripilus lineatus]|uniref:Uncharacterized protein n=1 Tax=Meripilus lineatus TaxID=2056292 RepID=A0AAD5YD69_9APHY|nr:hypothetical protein NLI96_g9144 [Physisporinus lineatus]
MLATILTFIASPLVIGAWWLLRDLMTSSPLDNIPGPRSPSWLSGHPERLYHRHNGWKLQVLRRSTAHSGYVPVSNREILANSNPPETGVEQDYEEASISFNNLMLGPGLVFTLND